MPNAEKSAKATVLILVHPGSACGSANFNLGSQLAQSYREALAADLDGWTGDMLVIDGELSAELTDPAFVSLGKAISNALARCRDAGFRVRRSWGCDNVPPHQAERIRAWIADGTIDARTMDISLTGAWYNNDGGGCVGGVQENLTSAGFTVSVRDSVVCELEDAELSFEGENEDLAGSPAP